MGGNGKTVEVDETFWGNKKPRGQKKGRGYHHKEKILTLVERGGKARSQHVPAVNERTLVPIIKHQIQAETTIYTDEAGQYHNLRKHYAAHEYVRHGIGDQTRVLSSGSTTKAIANVERGSLQDYIGQKALNPFIDKEKVLQETIRFSIPGTQWVGLGITTEHSAIQSGILHALELRP